ncbi:hypothetical protein [Nannocystis pusilla]|uniref:hypothetical protein n=1 Tax=Nannocystis pusilla TaxID=889268 RepID=UPI003B78E895
MAPEQAAGATIDVRADQFGLAMAMIHAAAGTVVPAGTTAAALPRSIPAAAREVLARAIAVRPSDRFARVADLASALAAPSRRWRFAVAGLGVAAIAAIAALAWPEAPPSVAALDESALQAAWSDAVGDNDASRCHLVVTGLVAIDKKYEGHRAFCEMLAGRCKAGVAMLTPAAATTVGDYCPADGDIPEGRADRALRQGKRGRSPAACARRATWVTTLAATPRDAEKFAMNAIQCFAGIGQCDAALEQAGVLAKLRATTPALELAQVAPECDR